MTDSIKFGPEWIRNISNDNLNNVNNSGSNLSINNDSRTTGQLQQQQSTVGLPRQLPEYRYGREEMLSLYEKKLKIPDILPSYKKLFIEQTQCPLALIPTTEGDLLLGINSSGGSNGGNGSTISTTANLSHSMNSVHPNNLNNASGASSGSTQAHRPWVLRSPLGFNSSGSAIRSSRGGLQDRGGRGGGRIRSGGFHSMPTNSSLSGYQRPVAIYDESNGNNETRKSNDRGWPERNGITTNPDQEWSNPNSPISSPRKEISSGIGHNTSTTGSSFSNLRNMENWRRGGQQVRSIDDDLNSNPGNGGAGVSTSNEGWRGSLNPSSSYRWTRTTSWRDEDFCSNNHQPINENATNESPSSNIPNLQRSMSTNSSLLDNNNLQMMNLASQSQINPNSGSKSVLQNNLSGTSSSRGYMASAPSWQMGSGKRNLNNISARENDDSSLPEWAIENPSDAGGSFDAAGEFHNTDEASDESANMEFACENYGNLLSNSSKSENDSNNFLQSSNQTKNNSTKTRKSSSPSANSSENDDIHSKIIKPKTDSGNQNDKSLDSLGENKKLFASMQKLNSNQCLDASGKSIISKDATQSTAADSKADSAKLNSKNEDPDNVLINQTNPKYNQELLSDRMQEVADEVAKLITDDDVTTSSASSTLTSARSSSQTSTIDSLQHQQQSQQPSQPPVQQPVGNSSTDLWYYRDPQGKVQGPFPAQEMSDWYRAGYFDENLYVRRVCDERYSALGELVKICGSSIPFSSSHLIPPLLLSNGSGGGAGLTHQVGVTVPNLQQKQQQQLFQHKQQSQLNPFLSSSNQNPILATGSGAKQHQQQKLDEFHGMGNTNKTSQADNDNSNPGVVIGNPADQNISPHITTNDITLLQQYEFLQKQFLLKQRQALLTRLSTSEPFNLLSREQQNLLLNQHLSQIPCPDYLANVQALNNTLAMDNPLSSPLHQILTANKHQIAATKISQQWLQHFPQHQQQQQPSPSVTNTFPATPAQVDFNSSSTSNNHIKNLLENHTDASNSGPMHLQHQHQPQPHLQKPETDPFKSLLMQLQLQKTSAAATYPIQNLASSLGGQQQWNDMRATNPVKSSPIIPPQQQPPAWGNGMVLVPGLTHNLGQQQPQSDQMGMWDFGTLNTINTIPNSSNNSVGNNNSNNSSKKSEDKSELELLKMRLPQNRNSNNISANLNNMEYNKQQQFIKGNQKINLESQKDLDQTKSLTTVQKEEAKKVFDKNDENNAQQSKSAKIDESTSALNAKKKFAAQALKQQQPTKKQPPQRAEPKDPSFIAVDDKRKQKEERKRQQDEERRRQQVEETKRREILDEERRQKDIEQHRRRALLMDSHRTSEANANKKQLQQRLSTSSVAPWSTTCLPCLQTPQPNFAEIQKAERERRAEEQRLEQLMESQRKIQHNQQQQQQQNDLNSILAKDGSQLIWNPPQIKVKSLAEIQAEESKRLALQQQQLAEQRRKQILENDSTDTPNQLSDSNNFGFIWNQSRQPQQTGQNFVWQSSQPGAAVLSNSNTSVTSNLDTSCSYESITSDIGSGKLPITAASVLAAGLQNNENKSKSFGLTKSQTLINIHQNNSFAGGIKKDNSTSAVIKQNSQSNKSPAVAESGPNDKWNRKPNNNNIINNNANNNNNNKSNNIVSSNNHNNMNNKSNNNSNISNSNNSNNNNNSNNTSKQKDISLKELAKDATTGPGTNNTKKNQAQSEFINWCNEKLSSMSAGVDVPTFITFLQDIESPFEVKEYIRAYLGETKEWIDFGKQFLERRSKYKNLQRAQNAHIDDMCVPAPAINPSSHDFQEIKSKSKKIKKGKMTKLDARILGFSVTAAQDRINVGDRDYGDAAL